MFRSSLQRSRALVAGDAANSCGTPAGKKRAFARQSFRFICFRWSSPEGGPFAARQASELSSEGEYSDVKAAPAQDGSESSNFSPQ
jgi:hypothetical protein